MRLKTRLRMADHIIASHLMNQLDTPRQFTTVVADTGDFKQLAACRIYGVDSENRPQRGQFLPDLQAHSPAMGQKDGEKWTAAVDSQPTFHKSDRLLGVYQPPDATTATEVKSASFRNVGQITELAGCDLLAISPELPALLAATEAPLVKVLAA